MERALDDTTQPFNETDRSRETEDVNDVADLAELETVEAPEHLLVEVETLRAALDERTGQLHDREQELAERGARERTILNRYREALAVSQPELIAADITGDTLEELDASFEAAKDFAARVGASTAASETVVNVPAGAPGRPETAPVTSFEKIRDGLATRR